MDYSVELSDGDLVEHCRDGNPDGFRLLVERYQGPVFGYLFTRIGDRAQAEDAAQETFVRAFFSLKKLKKPDSFHSWLIGIARRVAHEHHRSERRRAEIGRDAECLVPAQEEIPSLGGLDEAIAALPETHRQVILLRYFEGLSCREAAERLRVPIGTATKHLSRAYAELRDMLVAQDGNGSVVKPDRVSHELS